MCGARAAVLLVAALSFGASAHAAPRPDAAALFGARDMVEQVDLSPDGRRIVYLTPGPGASTAVVVQELEGNAAPRLAFQSDGNPERVYWCNFVGNDRLVCRIGALIRSGASYIPFERLVSLDLDGGNPKLLGRYARQFDGSIVDWLPDDEGHVLMGRNGGVDRVDVRTLRSNAVELRNANASSFMTDGRGHVRLMEVGSVRGATGMAGSRISYFFRIPGSERWHPLGTYDELSGDGLYPVAVDAAQNVAYVLKRLNGRRALYRITLDETAATELVYANPQVDVDDVVRHGRGTQVIGVTFADDARRKVYFNPAFAELASALGRAIPNLPLIDFVESSADGERELIHASSDADPGRYFVYHRSSRNLQEIMLDRRSWRMCRSRRCARSLSPRQTGRPFPPT